jgi:hypothetical protein
MTIRAVLGKIDRTRIELRAPKFTENIKKAKACQSMHASPLQVTYDPEYSFCTIRDPLSWYESLYRNKVVGEKKWYVNAWKKIGAFEDFVQQVLTIHPYGYVTRMYASFVPFVRHVLITDRINEQLPELLEKWGIECNKPIERKNVGKQADTTLSKGMKKSLLGVESGATELYKKYSEGK